MASKTWLEDAAIDKALNHLDGVKEQIERVEAVAKTSLVALKAHEAACSIAGTRALLRELRALARGRRSKKGGAR